MTAKADTIHHELNAIKDYISAVQDILAAGHMPEMIGLEKRIGDLCQSIQNADRETQQLCLPELKILLENIDACGHNLRAFHSSYLNAGNTSHD